MAIEVKFVGVDGWDRAIFQTKDGVYAKSVNELWYTGDGNHLEKFLGDLHWSVPRRDPEGEPFTPVGEVTLVKGW